MPYRNCCCSYRVFILYPGKIVYKNWFIQFKAVTDVGRHFTFLICQFSHVKYPESLIVITPKEQENVLGIRIVLIDHVHLCCAESAKQEKRKPGKTVLDKALEMKYILKKRRNV